MRTVIAAAVCLSLVGLSVAADVQASIKKTISIPAGGLGPALQTLSEERRIHVVFISEDINELRTEGAKGSLTIDETLKQLLKGTGLTHQYIDDETVSIVPIVRRSAATNKSAGIRNPHFAASEEKTSARRTDEASKGFWQRFRISQAETSGARSENSLQAATERSDSNNTIQEIIVTATKRAESIQDAPLSISAIGSAEIESRGLTGMGDYLSAVPGVSLIEIGSTSNAIVIRGIDTGPESQNFGAGTTVASYFGETPITNSAGLVAGSGIDIKLVDIDRIEILRGPQGTAFGNSSLGGAVRTIPVAPQLDEFGGKLVANYSSTSRNGGDNQMIQGVINAPLIRDRLALRAVGYRYENSGFYKNLAGSDAELQAYAASVGPRALSLATDADDRGRDEQRGARLSARFQATEDLALTLNYLHQQIEQDGFSFSSGRGDRYGYARFRILGSRGFRGSIDKITDNQIDIANLVLEYDLGWADLVASASWTDSDTQWSEGASLNSPYDFAVETPHTALASEIRLVSKLSGPLQFLAGVYHEKLDDFSHEVYSSLETPELELQNTGFGDGVNEVLGIFDNTRELKQDALFGELSYDLMENLTLSIGGRFYQFERDNRLETSGWFTGAPLGSPDVSAVRLSQSGESLKANLSYKPLDNTMLYVSWAEGFRLGRPAAGLIPAICDTDSDGLIDGTDITIASTREIDSDTLENFEVGGKFTLAGGRMVLNASAFRINWIGLPTNARATCGDASYFYVANAGEAKSQGLEIQSSLYLTQGLRIDLGGSYTNAELSTDVPDLNAVEGDRLPGSPEWIANLGLQYDFTASGYAAFLRADSSYRGSYFGNLAEDPLTESGGYIRADVRAGMTFNRVSVEAFVNNLTDVDDYVWRGLDNSNAGFGYIMRPRTVGVQVGYSF